MPVVTSYPLVDSLGEAASLTDSSGTVAGTYKYDVFGPVRSSTWTGSRLSPRHFWAPGVHHLRCSLNVLGVAEG